MGANDKLFLKAIAAGVTFALLVPAVATLCNILGIPWPQPKPKPPDLPNVPPKTKLASVKDVPQGIFRYGGSTSFAPLRKPEIVERIRQAHPGYELVYMEPPPGHKPGSGIGIQMLLDGQLSFSQSSRPVKTEEFNTAQQRNFKLEQIPVAIDGIAIYVPVKLNVTNLTLTQVKDIFTGKITNWKQINPNIDLAITPISRDPKDGGTPEFFQETILEKAPFASQTIYARDTTASLRKVATTPGAIGYASAPEVCDQQVKPLAITKGNNQQFVNPCIGKTVNQADLAKDIYPITRRLFVIIKRDGGQLDEKSGEAYAKMLLTDEGQEIISQAGLVPLRGISQSSKN